MELLSGLWYIPYLAAIMVLSAWAKKTAFFMPVYRWVALNVKSKRAVVAIISAITGVLPIEGRVTVSAGFLDTIAPNDGRRRLYGIIDYLSTHHYYFWSPLEKTVILPMAVLSLSYTSFIGYVWPLIVTCLVVGLFYIFFVLKEEDVAIDLEKTKVCNHDHPTKWLDWKILLIVTGVIVLGNYIKSFDEQMLEIVKNNGSLAIATLLSFLFSFAMGSSSKYAGFVSLLAVVFGPQYLPLFLAVDYTGYMLSPMHKCFAVGKTYFDTPIEEYYKAIALLGGSLIFVSIIMVTL
ncbi:DUF401 family protein [bacterium]|nr:DUF401 family protein [bacterium]